MRLIIRVCFHIVIKFHVDKYWQRQSIDIYYFHNETVRYVTMMLYYFCMKLTAFQSHTFHPFLYTVGVIRQPWCECFLSKQEVGSIFVSTDSGHRCMLLDLINLSFTLNVDIRRRRAWIQRIAALRAGSGSTFIYSLARRQPTDCCELYCSFH